METDKKRSPASSTRTAHDSDEIPRVHSDEVDIEMRTWHPEKAIAVAEGVTAAAEAIEEEEEEGIPDVGEHPDGGWKAWSVVMGCAAGACATFGLVNAWGVFQAYYTETILSDTDPSTIAWIGSVQYALVFIPGVVVGRIFDMGYTKLPLLTASALLVATTFLTAQCTVYWQFLLCQGIALGLACGSIFGIIMGCPAHWFRRKLGIALGMMALGSSIGGTLFPVAVENLIKKVGFQWTMRIMGFIEIFLLAILIAFVERRLPIRKNTGPFFDFTAFRNVSFSLYCASSFMCFLGIYTVLTYIDVSAIEEGIDPNFAFYLLSIANACSAVGRIAGGYFADRTGPLNVMTPATFLAGILTYIWPFATSKGGNIAVAIVYGASSGVYVSLLAAPAVRMGSMHNVGVRIGMSITLIALGALAGPPISGAINTATGSFTLVGVWAGTAVMVACCLMVATRISILHGLWGKC